MFASASGEAPGTCEGRGACTQWRARRYPQGFVCGLQGRLCCFQRPQGLGVRISPPRPHLIESAGGDVSRMYQTRRRSRRRPCGINGFGRCRFGDRFAQRGDQNFGCHSRFLLPRRRPGPSYVAFRGSAARGCICLLAVPRRWIPSKEYLDGNRSPGNSIGYAVAVPAFFVVSAERVRRISSRTL